MLRFGPRKGYSYWFSYSVLSEACFATDMTSNSHSEVNRQSLTLAAPLAGRTKSLSRHFLSH